MARGKRTNTKPTAKTVRAIDGRSDVAKAVKTEIYNALRESLVKPIGNTGKTWANSFIEVMLKDAKKNPNSAIGQIIAKQMLSDNILEKLDEATDKYLSRDRDFVSFRIMNTLYKEQRDIFLDNYRKKIAICSRRVGKTELAARLLLDDMKEPNHHAVFIALKFENAIRQCFNITLELAESLGMAIERSSKSDGEILFSNGSNILFKGNNNNAEADKLLGYKFSYAIIDECQNQPNLQYLIDTVLSPALADYEDSRMVLLGTPPRIPKTYVEKIWKEFKEWKHYSWTMFDNPFMKNVEEYLTTLCSEKGITRDTPFIQREYMAQWAWDTECQVFQNFKTYNKDDNLDLNVDYIYIGNDYGWQDYNSIIGVGVDRAKKKGYVFYEKKWNKSDVSTIVELNQDCVNKGRELLIQNKADISNIAIYGDTSDKSIIYEMTSTYNLPAYCCYKYDKANAITQLADYCRTGTILIPEGGILHDEMERTLYRRLDDDTITNEIDDNLFHPEAIMALLYASRQFHYDFTGSYEIQENYLPNTDPSLDNFIGEYYNAENN